MITEHEARTMLEEQLQVNDLQRVTIAALERTVGLLERKLLIQEEMLTILKQLKETHHAATQ